MVEMVSKHSIIRSHQEHAFDYSDDEDGEVSFVIEWSL